MTLKSAHARRLTALHVAAVLAAGPLAGCIGVSQSRQAGEQTVRSPGLGTTAPAGAAASKSAGLAGAAAIKRCPAGARAAADGLIDDFEDGNGQLSAKGDRDGYWYLAQDSAGSKINPRPLKPDADGAGKALHLWGQTVAGAPEVAWGVEVGSQFVSKSVLYDASRYAGVSFRAKIGGSSTRTVRFNLADVNTHKDAGLCTSCWNHFGAELTLTDEWKDYTVLFADISQAPGWGDPRPAAIVPEKLVAMVWKIGAEQTFDLWIDDVRFVDCP